MLFDRVGAAALFLCSALALPAAAASRFDAPEHPDLRLTLRDRAPGRAGGLERLSFDRRVADIFAEAASDRTRGSASPNASADLWVSAPHPGELPIGRTAAASAVPLPTGLSLFGSGILTLGLVGLLSGAQRRLASEAAGHADVENGVEPAEAAPWARFKIEVRSDRGHQVRHTGSARVAIDLIADLLNDGWDMMSISDRSGMRIDYEDVVDACNRERERCRAR